MKKSITVLASFFLVVFASFAQVESLVAINAAKNSKNVELRAIELPAFIGGQDAMTTYIQEEIAYPALAFRQGVEGVVLVNFRITKEGKIIKPYISQGVHPALDEEALRIVSEMPKWTPALQNGTPREVAYQLPIRFELND
ncbi:protein TonB [Belliella buryatensis]|jgi:periplasmic protein TonB|uniref:Protein TonB n=1 Tax=Belliella buryatensis TaxID=1500549 RepID=A0A239FTZ9_9BACT|nr:energy transducer TonB [Belliella buryatensis]SNS60616.1 protein TonB [Belliella buryatensis]